MRRAHLRSLTLAIVLCLSAAFVAHQEATAQDVKAGDPTDLSVTVYRDPYRRAGGFDLNNLNGFAFITETRRVVIPAGEHRLRFEGVSDGIEAVSAIISGLPSGVIEKNRDAALLSPSALVDAAADRDGRVMLARTDPATGKTTRVEGKVRSGAGGVVFETPNGIEALRCSGLPETFSFDPATTGLSAKPTLSVLTRTDKPIEAVVQLSYIARGFDWAADYTANMSASGKSLDLGAWLTLANGNGTGFANARVQVVAGRLNRTNGQVEPISLGQPIFAQCWPQGSTSDTPDPIYIERAFPLGFDPWNMPYPAAMAVPPPPAPPPPPSAPEMARDIVVTAKRAEQEDLGDLKLYRVPDRTTVASRQSKQVRMLDQPGVPIQRVHEVEYMANQPADFGTMAAILRTTNDKKNKLGLPLPSGRVEVFETVGSGAASRRLLAGETNLRDLAINEETELRFEGGAAVQARQIYESADLTPRTPLPFVPGKANRTGKLDQISRIEITNAQPYAVQVEARLYLYDGQEIVKADHKLEQKNGQPIFRVTVPANGNALIRYQTQASTR